MLIGGLACVLAFQRREAPAGARAEQFFAERGGGMCELQRLHGLADRGGDLFAQFVHLDHQRLVARGLGIGERGLQQFVRQGRIAAIERGLASET